MQSYHHVTLRKMSAALLIKSNVKSDFRSSTDLIFYHELLQKVSEEQITCMERRDLKTTKFIKSSKVNEMLFLKYYISNF